MKDGKMMGWKERWQGGRDYEYHNGIDKYPLPGGFFGVM